MKRRELIATLGLALPVKALSANIPINTLAYGPHRIAYVAKPALVMQECPMFCWAASLSMLFASAGHPVHQERIVLETFADHLECKGGTNLQIANALSRPWEDDNGQPFTVQITAAFDADAGIFGMNNWIVINELSNDRPMIVCSSHHAMLLVSVEYQDLPMAPNVLFYGVMDPFPTQLGFRNLSPIDSTPAPAGGMRFMASVAIS